MFRVHTPTIRSIRFWVAAQRLSRPPSIQKLGAENHESHGNIRTAHTTYAAALKTTTHPKTRCRKPYAATQHLMLLMICVCTQNMSSYEYINKITLLHQVGSSQIISNVRVSKQKWAMHWCIQDKFRNSVMEWDICYLFSNSPIALNFRIK